MRPFGSLLAFLLAACGHGSSYRAGDAQRHAQEGSWSSSVEAEAARRAASACDRGQAVGCVRLGNLFVDALGKKDVQDFFYSRGCELDDDVDKNGEYRYGVGSCDSVLSRAR